MCNNFWEVIAIFFSLWQLPAVHTVVVSVALVCCQCLHKGVGGAEWIYYSFLTEEGSVN